MTDNEVQAWFEHPCTKRIEKAMRARASSIIQRTKNRMWIDLNVPEDAECEKGRVEILDNWAFWARDLLSSAEEPEA